VRKFPQWFFDRINRIYRILLPLPLGERPGEGGRAVIARSVEGDESEVAISCEAATAETFVVKASLSQ